MKNKQKAVLKFILTCTIAFVAIKTQGQNEQLLSTADSLFQRKQYTQSMEIYERLFDGNQYSNAMLLRMAFVEEGLGHVSTSLYYLNLYYSVTGDDRVLEKIQQVATKYRLRGYEHSELRVIQYVINHYKTEVNAAIAVVIFFLFALLIYFKRKTERRPFLVGFGILAICVVLFSNLNFNYGTIRGIVKERGTYLMSGPSAGASVVAILGEGDMLPILSRQDVWVEVDWNGRTAYVKESRLLKIQI